MSQTASRPELGTEDLGQIRDAISDVDGQIIALLRRRFRLSRWAQEVKNARGESGRYPEIEKAIQQRYVEGLQVDTEVPEELVADIVRSIIDAGYLSALQASEILAD